MARAAFYALAFDHEAEIIEDNLLGRIKATRIVSLPGNRGAHVVVRSKYDGMKANFNHLESTVELKLRRSGAIALNAIEDDGVTRALEHLVDYNRTLSNAKYIVKCQDQVAEYVASRPTSYTPYVQSYYLSRLVE